MWSSTNIFICNMAVSDLAICIFAVPITPLTAFTGQDHVYLCQSPSPYSQSSLVRTMYIVYLLQSHHPTHSPSSQVRTMYILTNLITSLTVITGYFGEYVSFKETLLQFSILLTQLYLLHLTVLHFESCRQVWFELLQRGSKPRPFLALSFRKLDLKEGCISSKIRGHV